MSRNEDLSTRPVFRSIQPLILASESPRRLRLLQSLGLTFEVVPSGSEEGGDANGEPDDLVKHHAEEKAEAVSRRFPHYWVLSADTIVVRQRIVLGKPADPADAAPGTVGGPAGRLRPAMSIPVRGINHLVLRVDDLERMLRFYGDVLGCRAERRLDDLGLVQLRAGASLIDLLSADTCRHMVSRPGPTETRHGAEGNGPSIYLRDPEGNTVELKGPPTQPVSP